MYANMLTDYLSQMYVYKIIGTNYNFEGETKGELSTIVLKNIFGNHIYTRFYFLRAYVRK